MPPLLLNRVEVLDPNANFTALNKLSIICISLLLIMLLFLDSPMVLSLTPCTTESFEDIDTDELLPNILNIDQDTDADFDVPEYAQDIHNYLKKAEVKDKSV